MNYFNLNAVENAGIKSSRFIHRKPFDFPHQQCPIKLREHYNATKV